MDGLTPEFRAATMERMAEIRAKMMALVVELTEIMMEVQKRRGIDDGGGR